MQPRKFRIISAATVGSLALAAVAVTASSGTSPAPKHPALAAQTESFPTVNLDACPILHVGYPTGGCVAQLQTDLNLIPGNHLVVDGAFGSQGSQTYAAVIAFQQTHSLAQDGIVGPATKQALDAAISVATPMVPSATASAPITAQAPTTPAQAPSTPAQRTCGTAQDSMNVMDHGLPGVREGSMNLSVYWCWDGSKITSTATPYTWPSKTLDGFFLEWKADPPVTIDKDPQNGGYWTRETVVTGTVQECPPELDCLPTQPFKMDLYVFGDGVKYIANRVNI